MTALIQINQVICIILISSILVMPHTPINITRKLHKMLFGKSENLRILIYVLKNSYIW